MGIAGLPLLLTLVWTLLVYCQAHSQGITVYSQQDKLQINTSVLGCPFMTESVTEDQNLELLAYTVPVCAILVCNTVFLIWIMGVRKYSLARPLTRLFIHQIVISKLRSSDHQHQTQNINLRAAKALIIIVPLLGITYLVTIVGPSEPETPLETIFILTRNVLLSFQGFLITLPYCFLNGEVCSMMRTHWERWHNNKDIGTGPNSGRNSISIQGLHSVRRVMHECKTNEIKISEIKDSSSQDHLDGPLVHQHLP